MLFLSLPSSSQSKPFSLASASQIQKSPEFLSDNPDAYFVILEQKCNSNIRTEYTYDTFNRLTTQNNKITGKQ